MKRMFLAGALVTTCFAPQAWLLAAPLEKAAVTRVMNEVKLVNPEVGARAAAPGDEISGKIALRTGIASKSELLFTDKTLARMGANTIFSFEKGTRDMNLENGTILLQVPKDAGGARIRTAAVTAAITGTTVMIEFVKAAKGGVPMVKVLSLEGENIRVFLADKLGESVLLKPGQFLLVPANAKTLSDHATFDIEKVYETSGLIGGGFDELPSDELIDIEIAKQKRRFLQGDLARTNIVMLSGTELNLVLPENLDRIAVARTSRPRPTPQEIEEQFPTGGGGRGIPSTPGTGDPNQNPKFGPAPVYPGFYYLTDLTTVVTDPTISNPTNTHEGKIFDPASNQAFSEYLFGSTTQLDIENGFADNSLLRGQIGVFKFEDLVLGGDVEFDTTNGPLAVALVAQNSISPQFSALNTSALFESFGYWDLSPLRVLLLAAQNGPITFDFYTTFDDGTLGEVANPGPGSDLFIYGRSSSSPINYSANTYLSGAFRLVSLSDIMFSSNIDVGSFTARAGGTIRGNYFEDSVYARDFIDMEAQEGITLYGGLTAPLINLLSPESVILESISMSSEFVSITGGTVDVSGQIIAYHPTTPPANPPENIRIASTNTSGTGINITNSAILNAIANATGQGGNILLQTEGSNVQVLSESTIKSERGQISILSKGGNIDITDSTVQSLQSDNETLSGQILIDTNPSTVASVVNLTNAQLSADAVRVRAYGTGAALNISGGSINAGTLMHLYAEGAGGHLRFTGNTSLNYTGSGVLAAESITVNNGVNVGVNGPKIKIHTTNANYAEYNGGNGSASGEFTGSGAPGIEDSPEPFNTRPGF